MARKRIVRKPQTSEIHPRFADVVETFAKIANTSVVKMMSYYGLKVNRKIFAMFGKNRFVIKLPRKRVDELVDADQGERFDPGHGRLMKEWTVVGSGKLIG
jgi:hypothetical protein